MKNLLLFISVIFLASISSFAQDIEDMPKSNDVKTGAPLKSDQDSPIVRNISDETNFSDGILVRVGAARPLESHYGFDPCYSIHYDLEYIIHLGKKTPSSKGGTGKWGFGLGLSLGWCDWKANKDYVEEEHKQFDQSYQSLSFYVHTLYYLTQQFYLNAGISIDMISEGYDNDRDKYGNAYGSSLQLGVNYTFKKGFSCGLGYNLPITKLGMQSLNLTAGWYFNI